MFFDSLLNICDTVSIVGNCNESTVDFFQVIKSIWWMSWHQKAKKDVVSCDKPRGVASKFRSEDVRMGKPDSGYAGSSSLEYIE